MKNMTIFGIGHKLMGTTALYFIITVIFTIIFPRLFYIVPDNSSIIVKGGGVLVLILGMIFYIGAVRVFLKGYPDGKLITEGAYSMCRNPIYASWIVFIIPAIALMVNSWLIISVALFMYVMLIIFIKEEEEFLKEKFGDEFIEYCKKVNRVIPIKK